MNSEEYPSSSSEGHEILSSDEDSQTFRCKYCDFNASRIEDLDDHIISHDEAILEDENDRATEDEDILVYSSYEACDGPQAPKDKSWALPAFYQKYSNRDTKIVFVCPYCGYQTMKYIDLRNHLNEMHLKEQGSPVFVCSECPYATKRKHDINKHLVQHCNGSVPTFKCTKCPYETSRKYHLIRHTHSHKDENGILDTQSFLYKCTECGYSAKRLSDLNRHAVLHCDRTAPGVFKCTKCSYVSSSGRPFAKHVLSHCRIRETNDSEEENNRQGHDVGAKRGASEEAEGKSPKKLNSDDCDKNKNELSGRSDDCTVVALVGVENS